MAKKSASEFDMLALSYELKKSPLYDGYHVEMMDPDWITVTDDDVRAARRLDSTGLGVQDYMRTAPYLSDIADRLMAGELIDDIMKEDGPVGRAADQYFNLDKMIRADVYGGDEIRLEGRGVQQLLAAQRCDVPVPVLSIMQPEKTFSREAELFSSLWSSLHGDAELDDDFAEPWFMQEELDLRRRRRLPEIEEEGDNELELDF